ncbi:MAG: hypothetical protein WC243_03375 [Patescibacteria group bacterium]|jgi:hypothetical protein
MKKIGFLLIVLVFLVASLPVSAAPKSGVATLEVSGVWPMTYEPLGHVTGTFKVDGHFSNNGDLFWRYRLEGGKWSPWQQHNDDNWHFVVPLSSVSDGEHVRGEMQVHYKSTEAGSGMLSVSFDLILLDAPS